MNRGSHRPAENPRPFQAQAQTPCEREASIWPHRRCWRKRRDSNPRYPFRYVGFQDRCHQPLGHSSALSKIPRNQRPLHFPRAPRPRAERPPVPSGSIAFPRKPGKFKKVASPATSGVLLMGGKAECKSPPEISCSSTFCSSTFPGRLRLRISAAMPLPDTGTNSGSPVGVEGAKGAEWLFPQGKATLHNVSDFT